MKQILLIIISFFIFQHGFAQDWYKLEGNFSTVEYQQTNEVIADSLLEIAELSIPRLSKIFDIPDTELKKLKVRIILTDAPDVTNGYALADAVVIYALSSMYMDMVTGTQTWYSHVLKHELAHYFTFIKIKRKLNFLGEIANLSVPRWFFEGIAQYYTENWNTYRGDIYVRNAVLTGKLSYTSLSNMNDGRLLYASAHAFTRYLADQYGDSCLVKLMNHNEDGWLFDFDGAFEKIYGKNPEKIFTDFIRHMVIYYGDLLSEYPVAELSEELLSYGYRTLQVFPLSTIDSTYLVISLIDKNHRYKTALTVRYSKGIIQTIRTITNHVNTNVFLSRDKSIIAYGRYYFSQQSNQTNIKYLWTIYDLETGKTLLNTKAIRARDAVFDQNNNLILCEVNADQSILHRYNLTDRIFNIILKTHMPIGGLACLPDNSLVITAQRNNGFRDLFLYSDSSLNALTNDAEDDRNPIVINDSLIIFNRYIDDNPALAVYNLNDNSLRTVLNDQYAYWLHDYDSDSDKLIVSTWDPERHDEFALISADSIFQNSIQPDTVIKKVRYNSWTFKSPDAADMMDLPDTSINDNNRDPLEFPQSDLIHLFSAAIPLYDSDLGLGLFGITSWLEALQRQALAAMFVIYEKDINQSLVILSHNLLALNSLFSVSYYHGPVIFSHQNGSYINMNQDIGEIMWSKKYYIHGSNRFTYKTTLAYTGYYYNLDDILTDIPDNFGYHGPSLNIGLNYLLLTRQYPFLPKRQFNFSMKYFKSLNRQYKFGISELNLTLASNLFSESLGFKTRLTAINKHGTLPELKTIGVDRFYEFDFPRDFKYTRPIRGVRKDLDSGQLYWASTELIYLLSEHTGLTLLVLPIHNLALKGFFDYASLGEGKNNQVFSYGGEISFGQSLYRAGFGIAEGNYAGSKLNIEYYVRLSLYIPER